MQELTEEGMPLDGWTKTKSGNWERTETNVQEVSHEEVP